MAVVRCGDGDDHTYKIIVTVINEHRLLKGLPLIIHDEMKKSRDGGNYCFF